MFQTGQSMLLLLMATTTTKKAASNPKSFRCTSCGDNWDFGGNCPSNCDPKFKTEVCYDCQEVAKEDGSCYNGCN